MQQIKVTDLRKHLQSCLKQVREGEEIQITLNGKPIARLIPERERSEKAKTLLRDLRRTAWVGDVITPIQDEWEAGDDPL
jgi:prevent-host-death family protein